MPKRPDLSFSGERNGHWKGGGSTRADGRRLSYAPGHPRADQRNYVLDYILRAEAALGRALPLTAVVHHLDGDALNNANGNLVICENQAFHVYLHKRLRAWRACGHADWVRCHTCRDWKAPGLFPIVTRRYQRRCLACNTAGEIRRRDAVSASKRRYWAERRRGAHPAV